VVVAAAMNILLLGSTGRISGGDPTAWTYRRQRTDADHGFGRHIPAAGDG